MTDLLLPLVEPLPTLLPPMVLLAVFFGISGLVAVWISWPILQGMFNTAKNPAPLQNIGRQYAPAILTLFCVLGSFAAYTMLGNIGIADQPWHVRYPPDFIAAEEAAQKAFVKELATARNALEKRREVGIERPEMISAWIMLADGYRTIEDYKNAAEALNSAINLGLEHDRPIGQLWILYGETLTLANQGIVTSEASEAFKSALEDTSEPPENLSRASYYLALQKYQQGNLEGALTGWRVLLETIPPNTEWMEELKGQITKVKEELGL